MTNASDGFFNGGQSLNYGPTTDTRWLGRPRGGMIISEPREEQQTTIKRVPMFWDAAQTRPMMQLVFTVVCDGSGPAAERGWQTSERVDHADQGHRTVYVKGKDKTEAIKAQLQQHGRPGLRVGDHYYECWTGLRDGKEEGTTARTWEVMLFPGVGQAQQQFFGNEQQPVAAAAPQGFGAPGPIANTPAQVAQAWGNPSGPAGPAPHPGPPPQFGAPAAQPPAANGFGQAQPSYQSGDAQHAVSGQQGFGQAPPQYATPAAPSGFGAPPAAPPQTAPPANPWGQAPPASNPYAG